MNQEEAKAILSAWRDMDDPAEVPGLLEALSVAESDSDLQDWFTRERNFDSRVASVISEVEVPPGLRERILSSIENQQEKTPSPLKSRSLIYFPRLIPLAASLVVVFFVSLLLFGPPSVDADTALEGFSGHISRNTKTSATPSIASTDYEVIRQHFNSVGVGSPPSLSPRIDDLQPTGADTTEWDGLILGIVHLQNDQSAEFRLFIFSSQKFPEPESLPANPSLRDEEGIRVLIWTETDYVYGLCSKDAQADVAAYVAQ
ncbi:MAG: hypothetical protein AAGJ81_00510 [Verrucomicrobiota bacterium]